MNREERIKRAIEDPVFFANHYLGYDYAEHQNEWLKIFTAYQQVMILAPVEFGKSLTLDVKYLIWRIVTNRTLRVALLSRSEEQVRSKLWVIESHLTSNEKLIKDFGAFKDDKGWSLNDGILTIKRPPGVDGPTVTIKGLLGELENRRFDLIILDDIISWKDYINNKMHESILRWYREIMSTRLPADGELKIIGSPIEKEDLYEELIDQGRMPAFIYSALKLKTDKSFLLSKKQVAELFDPNKFKPKELESLWPEEWTVEQMINKINDVTLLTGNKKYLCRYVSERSFSVVEMIKKSKNESLGAFTLDRFQKLYPDFKRVIGVDPGSGAVAGTFFALAVLGYSQEGGTMVLLDLLKKRIPSAAQRDIIKEKSNQWQPERIIIENDTLLATILSLWELDTAFSNLPWMPLRTGTEKYSPTVGLTALTGMLFSGKLIVPYGDDHAIETAEILFKELRKGKVGDATMSIFKAMQGVKTGSYKYEPTSIVRGAKWRKQKTGTNYLDILRRQGVGSQTFV